jgi:hypothetical protein
MLIFGEFRWHARYLAEMCLFLFELKMSRVVFTLAAVILKDEQVNIDRPRTADLIFSFPHVSSTSSSYICHGVGPLADPFWSRVSRSPFKGLP